MVLILLTYGCRSLNFTDSSKEKPVTHPEIDREFRAAWVATVANINWPSAPGIPVEQQKQEAIDLLNLLEETHFNAVIFQVRPQADALYESTLEPWSYYLSGEQGVAPDPYYDPLEFWIEEAHKRGLELHVWMNPYRAHHVVGGPISEHSVVKTKSDLVVELSSGYYWFDPAKKGTQDHSHAVVMDIVKRYDIDGVHFDDYFYPYPSYNDGADFPDNDSWNAYQQAGGKMSRADWRRNAVDTFVERVYNSIKKEKPYVKFGLSPFGVWRPGNPKSIAGLDQYDVLYADAKKWLNEGWVDYFSPQLYWPINQIPQSFPVLLGWWQRQNHTNRYVWPGMSIGRFEGEKQIDEVLNQIMITRGMMPKAPGTIHWSIAPLVASDSLQTALKTYPYAGKALIPPLQWIPHKIPQAPEVHAKSTLNNHTFTLQKDPQKITNWIVYARYGDIWETQILNKNQATVTVPAYKTEHSSAQSDTIYIEKISLLNEVQITFINRLGFESRPFVYKTGRAARPSPQTTLHDSAN